MAFEMLKTDYQDDVLNTAVNQLRCYTVVNNASGSISLVDVTAYTKTGTFIGAKDINTMCRNMNTIMGYIETSSGDLAQEFQDYFNEQKGIFEDNVEEYMQDFQSSSQSQFTVWYDANTAAWSQEVNNRINAIIASLTALVNDNGPFVLNKAYKVGNLLTWNIGDGITRGYLVINPVPANMGIYPSNSTYFMEVTREGAQGVGLGLTPRGAWNNLTTYVANDFVVHNWIYWWCKTANTNSEPTTSNSNWEKIYDITAEMPIQFSEPGEDGLSFKATLAKIIPGEKLGNLFKYIKSAFLKLSNKFTDTEYTATGTSITYNCDADSKAFVTKITGVTTATKSNASAEVSPNNPQTFTSAENFVVNSMGKNILPMFSAKSVNGITMTVATDGTITLNGTATAQAVLYGGKVIPRIEGNLVMSANNPVANDKINIITTRGAKAENPWVQTGAMSVVNTSRSLTVASGLEYISTTEAAIVVESGTTLTNFTLKPQLEYSAVATAYEPYIDSTFTVAQTLGSVPGTTVADTLEYDSKMSLATLTKRRSYILFDGSSDENWQLTTTTKTNTAVFFIPLAVKVGSAMRAVSSRFPYVYDGISDTEHFINLEISSTAGFVFFVNKSRLTGWSDSLTTAQKIALLRTFLAANSVSVVYELTTPLVTTVSLTPILDTYDGITVITTNSAVRPELTVDFMSRLWALDDKKIDKANIAHNLLTNNTDMVLGADMGLVIQQEIDDIRQTSTTIDSRFVYDQLASWTTAELTANTLKTANWNLYEALVIEYRVYNNVYATVTVKTSYFSATSSTSRVIIDRGSGVTVSIYQSGTSQIKVDSANTFANSNLFVYGFIKK